MDEALKEKIRQRVKELLKEKGGTSTPAEPEAGGGEDSAGSIILFDEPVSREARIASRIVAIDFPTQDAFDAYLEEHPDADRSMHKVVEEKGPGKKEEVPSKERKPGEEEEIEKRGKPKEKEKGKQTKKGPDGEAPSEKGKPEKKEPEKKLEEKAPAKKELEREVSIGDVVHHPANVPEGASRVEAVKDELAKEFGKDAPQWRTHKLDKRQMKKNVTIRFPDGTSKKYKDCTDDEKQRVNRAIDSGMAASKGMNDYTQVNASAMRRNMENNLAHYDDKSVEVPKNTSPKPVTKEDASKVASTIHDNAETVLRKYSKALSRESMSKAREYVKDVSDAVGDAVADGSLSGVSDADIDEFIQEDVKRMVHQDIETRGRSLGDHGARHVAGNVRSTTKILGELKNSGIEVTGKQRLMAMTIQSNHDMGYTVGGAGVDVRQSSEHVGNSKELAMQEKARYEKIFGEKDTQKVIDTIGTHDSFDMDWEKDPVASAVRLADNTALFGNDKVQDLFIRSPKTVGLACKLRMAAEMIPPEPKEPKKDGDKYKPEDYKKVKAAYDADKKEYDETMATPEMQAQVKESKEIQADVKKQMHEAIDDEVHDELDSDLLHSQVDEMTEEKFSTSADVLSRYSGKLEGFKYDPKKGVMSVNMKYSPEGQTIGMVFGDDMAAKQFDKFAKDGKATPIRGKFGRTVFKSKEGKPVIQMNIVGEDKDPVQEATTEPMKDFLEHTARHELRRAANIFIHMGTEKALAEKAVAGARKVLEGLKDKATEAEWKVLHDEFFEMTKGPLFSEEGMAKSAKKLKSWPPLESEKNYLRGKTASALRRIAGAVALGVVADRVVVSMLRRFAVRGMQIKRKNTDIMRDTGGGSKHPYKEPEIKPSRTDVRDVFRTKNLTKMEKDLDTDRDLDKEHDSDMKLSSEYGVTARRELARWPARFADAVRRDL